MKYTDQIYDYAMNGQEALDKIKQNVEENLDEFCNYELILMDCNMPIMDGYEATKQIREFLHSKGLPQPVIIAVTGHTAESYIQKAFYSGMNGLS